MAGESVNERQRRHWETVSAGWHAWADWTDANFQPLTRWFQERGAWRPGSRVLDIACGPGYPAIAAAEIVQPGMVVGIDISGRMVEVATRRAAERRLDNITFVEMDAEHLRFDADAFDAVTNAYGLMFCGDPCQTLREARRVLRPGGALAIATWDQLSQNPFFSIVFDAAAPLLGLAPASPGAPGPFRHSSPTELLALLETAGFVDCRVENLRMTCEFAAVDDYVRIFSDVSWKARIASLSPERQLTLREDVARAVSPFVEGDRLRLDTRSWCASARKPE